MSTGLGTISRFSSCLPKLLDLSSDWEAEDLLQYLSGVTQSVLVTEISSEDNSLTYPKGHLNSAGLAYHLLLFLTEKQV